MSPIIFLDIDGVLNDHTSVFSSGNPWIQIECVRRLNAILDRTQAKVVVSSAWRYQILRGDVTLKGFQYMLISHGVNRDLDIIGCTPSDEDVGGLSGRHLQILDWLTANKHNGPWVVLDDLPLGDDMKEYHVRTDANVGLTDEDVEKAVAIIKRKNFWPSLDNAS